MQNYQFLWNKAKAVFTRRKYKLTGETLKTSFVTLHRIQALRDFGVIKSGDLGGFVQSERNLSHSGTAWVSDYALVFGGARVSDKALVSGKAWVCGNARVSS